MKLHLILLNAFFGSSTPNRFCCILLMIYFLFTCSYSQMTNTYSIVHLVSSRQLLTFFLCTGPKSSLTTPIFQHVIMIYLVGTEVALLIQCSIDCISHLFNNCMDLPLNCLPFLQHNQLFSCLFIRICKKIIKLHLTHRLGLINYSPTLLISIWYTPNMS